MNEEIDTYKAEVKPVGSSIMTIIPSNIVKFSGVKEGDKIQVWFKILKDE